MRLQISQGSNDNKTLLWNSSETHEIKKCMTHVQTRSASADMFIYLKQFFVSHLRLKFLFCNCSYLKSDKCKQSELIVENIGWALLRITKINYLTSHRVCIVWKKRPNTMSTLEFSNHVTSCATEVKAKSRKCDFCRIIFVVHQEHLFNV